VAFPSGKYDNTHAYIRYNGWYNHKVSQTYNNTEHYSLAIGSNASFAFYGNSLTLHYRKYSNFGLMSVMIDGAPAGLIDQYGSPSDTFKTWGWSGTTGYHSVQLTHLTNQFVVLDAITVGLVPTIIPTSTSAAVPTATLTPYPPQSGIHDDISPMIDYTGVWDVAYINGAYNYSEHYSHIVGQTATLQFTGTQVSVRYRRGPLFGSITITIDGGIPVIINQYYKKDGFQQYWTSPVLGAGNHTIVITHNQGGNINLDSIDFQ
jgi:hypothetical protein